MLLVWIFNFLRKFSCSCFQRQNFKGLFTPSDYATVIVTLTGDAFEDQKRRPSMLR